MHRRHDSNASSSLQAIMSNKESRNMVMYIGASFLCMLVEMYYGVTVSCLGLVNDGFHLLFNCAALSITLFAMVLARRGPTFEFTYGFERHEVVAAFTNSMFLLFVSFYLAVESLHRVVNPVRIVGPRLLEVSLGGLAVNLVGAVAFKSTGSWLGRHAAHTQTPSDGVNAAHNANLRAAYLLIFADTASSVCVVINAVLVHWKGYMVADPLLAMAVAGLTLYSVWPLFAETAKVLLQTTPQHLRAALDRCRREVSTVDGVLECKDEHFWTQAPGNTVGSVVVRVRADASEQEILEVVSRKFGALLSRVTVQIEKDPPLDWMTGTAASSPPPSLAATAIAAGAAAGGGGHHNHNHHGLPNGAGAGSGSGSGSGSGGAAASVGEGGLGEGGHGHSHGAPVSGGASGSASGVPGLLGKGLASPPAMFRGGGHQHSHDHGSDHSHSHGHDTDHSHSHSHSHSHGHGHGHGHDGDHSHDDDDDGHEGGDLHGSESPLEVRLVDATSAGARWDPHSTQPVAARGRGGVASGAVAAVVGGGSGAPSGGGETGGKDD